MKVTRTKSLQSSNAPVRVYPPNEQGSGSFDGGKITEIKPIGFPGEGSARTRIGPLFYWAWATANGPATMSPGASNKASRGRFKQGHFACSSPFGIPLS